MKIDTTKIEGFENMTAEEKLAALQNYEFAEEPVQTNDVSKLKTLLSKANSEAKSYKDQLRAKQSEAERAEAEREENERKMREELEALRKKDVISGFKTKYLELGYDGALAESTANAMADGDMETVFKNQATFNAAQKTAIETAVLNKSPGLSSGNPVGGKDIESATLKAFRQAAGLI